MSEVYALGARAFYQHKLVVENPYKSIHADYARQWNDGWWHSWRVAYGKN